MDAERVPVIAAAAQTLERESKTSAVELAVRASEGALGSVAGLRERIQRLSMVSVVFSDASPLAASEVVQALGIPEAEREMTRPGGNAPQWLVTRAARAVANGELRATLLVGAEASHSAGKRDVLAQAGSVLVPADGPRDTVVGPKLDGVISPAEMALNLLVPSVSYSLVEAVVAHRRGASFDEHRIGLGPLMSSFSRVASEHPNAWFRKALSAEEISQVSADNRLIAGSYPKRMNAFPRVDQAAAVVVTSLAVAKDLGIADRCSYIWSGAECAAPALPARPDLIENPALGAAARAALDAAGVGADDLEQIDLYSCFPSAVQAGAAGLGIALDDPRRLTVTGGLPFFGGPGNNYSMHAIATMHDRLLEGGGLGYVGANGGILSKHAIGIYGATPSPRGFVEGDTRDAQARVDATALPIAMPADGAVGRADVVASTVVYGRDGAIAAVPAIAVLADGRRVAAQADESTLASLPPQSLIGQQVELHGDPLRFRI